MATNTYTALDKITIGTAVNSVTFSNISQNYTDLILVANFRGSGAGDNLLMQVGNTTIDTGNNYSSTGIYGNGSTAYSWRQNSINYIQVTYAVGLTGYCMSTVSLMNYANTSTYKPVLTRSGGLSGTYNGTEETASLWNSTSAINTIKLYGLNNADLSVGSTFSLYGIKEESTTAPKATGGTIYSDATYFYHIFGASGTFTPSQTITADAVVVGGGGGGGWNNGGGGGGGEIAVNTGGTYTSGTGVTVTIGAGGTFATSTAASGSNGGQTSLVGVTNGAGGGGGGTGDATGGKQNGQTGGSGGGGSLGNSGGAASGSNTNAGGSGYSTGNNYQGGGGGGATSAGTNAVSGDAGDGGQGKEISTIFSGLNLSGINILASGGGGGGYLASGYMIRGLGGTNGGNGGIENSGAGNANPVAGAHNSGSGGGGGAYTGVNSRNGAAGGSGIVIIRYLKA